MPTNPYQPPAVTDALEEHEHQEPPLPPPDESIGPAIFGAGVRLVGLLLALYGLYWAFYGFLIAAGAFRSNVPPIEYAIAATLSFAAGLALIRGAPIIVGVAYGEASGERT
jgi:hypothetical protein